MLYIKYCFFRTLNRVRIVFFNNQNPKKEVIIMTKKRFFIGGVEVEENGRRDHVLHLIDIKLGRFYRFPTREKIGEIVATLCSPGYADTMREDCRVEASEGRIVDLPLTRVGHRLDLDDVDDLSESLQEAKQEAVIMSLGLEKEIAELVDAKCADKHPRIMIDEFFDDSQETMGLVMDIDEDYGIGSGPIFNFDRDFTFSIDDIPLHLRDQYHILSFETAQTAAMQYDQVLSLIDNALEKVGAKQPTPKEPAYGRININPPDDSLAFENMRFMQGD